MERLLSSKLSLVLSAFMAGSLGILLQFGPHFSQFADASITDSPDPRFNFLILHWISSWAFGDLADGTPLVQYPIFYPFASSLALSSSHLGSLPLLAAIRPFADDWLLAGNLWLVASTLLNFLAAFYCSYRFVTINIGKETPFYRGWGTGEAFALALLVACAFAFTLARAHYIQHNQLVPFYPTPFFFYFAWRGLRTGRRKFAVFAAMALAWQCWLDVHNTIMVVLLAAVTGILFSLRKAASEEGSGRFAASLAADLKLVGIFIPVFLLLCAPLLNMYAGTAAMFGTRSFEEAQGYAITEKGLFWVSDYVPLLGRLGFPVGQNEKTLFTSIVFYPLLSAALIIPFRQLFGNAKKFLPAFLVLVPFFVYFDFAIHRSALARMLHEFVPGFDSIRAPNRLCILFLPIVILSLLQILQMCAMSLSARAVRRTGAVLSAVILAELTLLEYPVWKPARDSDLAAALNEIPGSAVVLPVTDDPFVTLNYQEAATLTSTRILNGYSGFEFPASKQLISLQKTLSPQEVIACLRPQFAKVVLNAEEFPFTADPGRESFRRFGRYILIEGRGRTSGGADGVNVNLTGACG